MAPPVMATRAFSPTQMAPPKPVIVLSAWLPLKVLLLMLTMALPKLANSAPALPAVLSLSALLVIVTGPSLKMAPPLWLLSVWLWVMVAWSSVRLPWLVMAPPSPPVLAALSSTMCAKVNVTLLLTTNSRVATLPVSVTALPPSSVASWLTVMRVVSVMVVGPPQLKVIVPPPARADSNPAWVQLVMTVPAGAASAARPNAAVNIANPNSASTATNAAGRLPFTVARIERTCNNVVSQPEARIHSGRHRTTTGTRQRPHPRPVVATP